MERDPFNCTFAGNRVNFNSHAHVERDRAEQAAARMQVISTHTLTWSVTAR